MTRARLTAILCPSCRGTGQASSLNWPCAWCLGKRRIGVEAARYWAQQCETLAIDGYIQGDHGEKTLRQMQNEARAAIALIDSFGDGWWS
jgi:hypothetical protein